MGNKVKSTTKPEILSRNKNSINDIENFKQRKKVWKTIDLYDQQSKELFEISNPHLKNNPEFEKLLQKFLVRRKSKKNGLYGNWIYYPWNGELVHIVSEKELNLIRTNRNRNLITIEEQTKLLSSVVGVFGLSIGGAIAISLAYQGIANHMKLADFDTLETTNLNRIRTGLSSIGAKKIDILSQQIYELNPYANLSLFEDGVNLSNISKFYDAKPRPQLVFDAIDDFKMKVILRVEARKRKIPVVMVTNLGDSVLVDVERFDKKPNAKLFNGVIGDLPERILSKNDFDSVEIQRLAVQIVGKENVPKRALESLSEIGKTLSGRPQLMSTVTISSGIATFVARKILLGEYVKSGRRIIEFDKWMQN